MGVLQDSVIRMIRRSHGDQVREEHEIPRGALDRSDDQPLERESMAGGLCEDFLQKQMCETMSFVLRVRMQLPLESLGDTELARVLVVEATDGTGKEIPEQIPDTLPPGVLGRPGVRATLQTGREFPVQEIDVLDVQEQFVDLVPGQKHLRFHDDFRHSGMALPSFQELQMTQERSLHPLHQDTESMEVTEFRGEDLRENPTPADDSLALALTEGGREILFRQRKEGWELGLVRLDRGMRKPMTNSSSSCC